MHIRYARLTGALAATLLVSACAGDRATSELVTGIPSASLVTARTGSAVSLRVRDSVQLTPVNLKRSVRWSSSNPGVAGVSRSGMVVGVAGGTALITASGGNGLERTTVSVASATPTVTSLTLSPGTAQLSTGGRQQFAVSARWSDGSTALPPVTYSATGGTISSSGLYTAGSLAGTFMVVATCACGVADTSAVAIQTAAPAPTVTALRISPKDVSVAASATVYDPLGLISPFTVRARTILQTLWGENLDWDTPVPDKYITLWKVWLDELFELPKLIKIPRHIGLMENLKVELHVFVDASTKVFAATVYARILNRLEVGFNESDVIARGENHDHKIAVTLMAKANLHEHKVKNSTAMFKYARIR